MCLVFDISLTFLLTSRPTRQTSTTLWLIDWLIDWFAYILQISYIVRAWTGIFPREIASLSQRTVVDVAVGRDCKFCEYCEVRWHLYIYNGCTYAGKHTYFNRYNVSKCMPTYMTPPGFRSMAKPFKIERNTFRIHSSFSLVFFLPYFLIFSPLFSCFFIIFY